MIEELNNIRNQVVLERRKFRENLSEYLKNHNLIIGDLASAVSKTSGKSVADIYSRISSGYIDDELWAHIEFYLRSL